MSTERVVLPLPPIGLSAKVSNGIAQFFYRLGTAVAIRPWTTIAICFAFVGATGLGFLCFRTERDPLKLWIPQNSKFLADTEWLVSTFKEGLRMEHSLITAPNVLHPDVLMRLLDISEAVLNLEAPLDDPNLGTVKYSDICLKIPIITGVDLSKINLRRRRQVNGTSTVIEDEFNDDFFGELDKGSPATGEKETTSLAAGLFKSEGSLFQGLYCGIINSFPLNCYQQNLLELWNFNRSAIQNLTVEDILNTINTVDTSLTTGHKMNATNLLGDIKRDDAGLIIGAGSLITQWFVHVNFSEVDHEKHGNIAGTENWATEKTLNWEEKYLTIMEGLTRNLTSTYIKIYYCAERSFGDISAATMFQDMDKLIVGIILMFVYMQVVLSKFSWVELRLMLGSMGLFSVGMAFVTACGICSLLGVKYGPVHTSLPFLLMGLGVDDMFVMMACWRKIQFKEVDIPERIGLMLSHAGASITVTSVTDIAAFLIGSITVLPSLQSFCIYATFGIAMTYIFAVTFFVAVFTLDEYRIRENRNSVLPFIKHEQSQVSQENNLMWKALNNLYRKYFLTTPGKCIIIVSTVLSTIFNGYNMFFLDQRFDPVWFVPTSTYLFKYIEIRRHMFPEMGFEAGVYFGQLNYTEEFPKILNFTERMNNQTQYLHEVNSWTNKLQDFSMEHMDTNLMGGNVTDERFRTVLSKFLYSPEGGKYQAHFRFKEKLKCGEPAPPITLAGIPFKFRKFNHRNEYLPAMRQMDALLADVNITSGDRIASVWSKVFGNWITDEIIDAELLRNISLALICVMGCTVLLVMNLNVCFWIFACVILTLINVCGMMYRWGLTIDMVSCIALQLAVGLCVDYAAHIGHTFLITAGTNKSERAIEAVLHIGSAVIYGGGSTLLGVVMLSLSDAYTFKAFFKIFLLVVLYGLFHGLILLPVVLSLIGPQPYNSLLRARGSSRNASALKRQSADISTLTKMTSDGCSSVVPEKLTSNLNSPTVDLDDTERPLTETNNETSVTKDDLKMANCK